MRLSSIAVRIAAFALAALLSTVAARQLAVLVEERSVLAVREALIDGGHDWASVLGDGLQIVLEGEAPSEAVRFRAMSVAGGVVDASRLIDNMSVVESQDIGAPTFAIEILRNDEGISLIGLIPAETDRAALSARIAEIAGDLPVADFLETADRPAPEGWRRSVTFGLQALSALPRSKVSIAAGRVGVTAVADTIADQRRLVSDLARSRPAGVEVVLEIEAPRPVVSPFAIRLVKESGAVRIDSCVADTEEARDRILAAAVAAGATGQLSCPLALGAPSRSWGAAAEAAIAALGALGDGTLTIADADVRLSAAVGSDAALFGQVTEELHLALPEPFVLEATLPEAPVQAAGPVEFTATRSPEGVVQLRGPLPDEVIAVTVENFALARFAGAEVDAAMPLAADLPAGWPVRVLAGVEALSHLTSGAATVSPERIAIRGQSGNPEAQAEVTRLMIDKLGPGAEITVAVEYVEALDPIAALPTPEECVRQIEFLTRERKITFDPGSTALSAAALPILDDIAEVLRRCPDLTLEVAGYTDSQGSEEGNLRISQARAESVLTALRDRRVPVSTFVAMGYGEADPIADNDTEEGREANRRIEFRLIGTETETEAEAADQDGASAAEAPAAAAAEDAAATD